MGVSFPKGLAVAGLACLLLSGCTAKPDLPYPELPRKDWLGDTKKAKLEEQEKPAEGIYSPDKTMTLTDLVYLAIQQSPALNSSAINLDIQRINVTDAKFKYLPEIHLVYTISNNVTRYNESKKNKLRLKDYGETVTQVNFGGNFNNPIATYFGVQAQKELMKVAEERNKDAVAVVINELAATLLQIRANEQSIGLLEHQKEFAEKSLSFLKTQERYQTNIWDSSDIRLDTLKSVELGIEEKKVALAQQRNHLKTLLGLGREMPLKVDTESVIKEIQAFRPESLDWKQVWETTSERYLLRENVRLQEAGIYLAWAQYFPNVRLSVNESAPNGQSQPNNGETDKFAHISVDFPLIDWGHRWRDADKSVLKRRQARLDEVTRRQQYSEKWFAASDTLKLAEIRRRNAEHAVESQKKRMQAVQTAFEHGGTSFLEYSRTENDLLKSQADFIKSDSDLLKARLEWMNLAQVLRNRYLAGAPHDDD